MSGFRGGLAKAPWVGPNNIGSAGALTPDPTWIKFTVTHTQLQAAATSNNILLFTLPAGGVLGGVKTKHSVAFAGGSIASYTISVGLVGNLQKYSPAFDVFQAVGNTLMQMSNVLASENQAATVAIQIAAVATGANLSASTAGSVDIWLLLSVAV